MGHDDFINPNSVLLDPNALLQINESLLPVQKPKVTGITHVSFDGLIDPPLRLKEDLKEGCGGQLWPAGMVLAEYMLRMHQFDLLGKTMCVPMPSRSMTQITFSLSG